MVCKLEKRDLLLTFQLCKNIQDLVTVIVL